ncbi:MAG: hypothetical protein HN344_00910 [Gammaproteobacteria bacterium]|jgi:type IV pilus assembly protein PilF|nr:hypothetical protein [Gammaproteobacteria bacterium]
MWSSVYRVSGGIIVLWLSACTMQQPQQYAQPGGGALAQTQLELGLGYLEQERLQLAQQHLEKAVFHASPLHPVWRKAHYGLALSYLRSGEDGRSEHYFLRALQGEASYPEAENGLGVLFCRQGRMAEANGYFQRAIDNPHYSTPEVARKNRDACSGKGMSE